MNKLLLVEDINELNNGEYSISYNNSVSLVIKNKVILHNIDIDSNDLYLNLESNSNLFFDKINLVKRDTKISIDIKDNSILEYNMLIINEGTNKLELNVNMLGNDSKAILKVRVINKSEYDNINFICNGFVLQNTKDNLLLEDLKGLVLTNDIIKISPNMEVMTNEVMANHLVTVASFNKDEIFYLTSKGLSVDRAKGILVNSFMNNILSECLKNDKILEVINIE